MTYFTIIFAFLITIVCFWASIKLITTYLRVKNWQTVEARILSKKAEIRKKRSNSGTAIYVPVIEYSYELNGNSYQGSKVYLEELLGGARSARKHQVETKLNSIGEKAMVYVDPKDPSVAVMFCSGMGIYFFMMMMGVVSFFVGLVNLLQVI